VTRWCLIAAVAVLAGAGCGGGNDDGQDFGNLIDSAQGTQLTRAEHSDGWGKRECFACHPVEEIHRTDRSGTGVLPLEDIRALVADRGLASCAPCHGTNGIGD
jgi:hypothetical protein